MCVAGYICLSLGLFRLGTGAMQTSNNTGAKSSKGAKDSGTSAKKLYFTCLFCNTTMKYDLKAEHNCWKDPDNDND